MSATVLWFRQDLRLADNAALSAAVARGFPVIPVFVFDPESEGKWASGGASRWWLHHSLTALDASLRERGSRLIVRQGSSASALGSILRAAGADAVYWNRRYEPAAVSHDTAMKARLKQDGVEARSYNSSLLHEPHSIVNRAGGPFQVYTPYFRHWSSLPIPPASPNPPSKLRAPGDWPRSEELKKLGLLPKIAWDARFSSEWTPGEAGARRRLKSFLPSLEEYVEQRDVLAAAGTSRLSPHLHFGEIGPRQVVGALRKRSAESGVFPSDPGAAKFLSEIAWREFAHHLLFHFPDTPERPLRRDFESFPWAEDPRGIKLRAWQRGKTGYPVVDAAQRQLWATGWMHNRARMVTASFLVKHLRLPWQEGARWFWDTLVDADLANNTLGWQWSAGCGADAAPYFRIFAPVRQGERFDPTGDYVRRWVPELAKLSAEWLHCPWEAPTATLKQSGVVLGGNYPRPIVDHAEARAAALAALKRLPKGTRP